MPRWAQLIEKQRKQLESVAAVAVVHTSDTEELSDEVVDLAPDTSDTFSLNDEALENTALHQDSTIGWHDGSDELSESCNEGGAETFLQPEGDVGPSARILMVSDGSRGDVQPLVALARALLDMRHDVRLLTNVDHISFCRSHQVDAVPVYYPQTLIHEKLGCGSAIFSKQRQELIAAWYAENPGVCTPVEVAMSAFQPDMILFPHRPSREVLRYEATAGVPAVQIVFARHMLEAVGWSWVRRTPVRPALIATSVHLDMYGPPLPNLPQLHHTGAWFLRERPTSEELHRGPLTALAHFLQCGPPPIAIGWGSMIVEDMTPTQMLVLSLRVLRTAGRRGIIIGGWAKLDKLANELVDGNDRREFVLDGGITAEEAECLSEYARSQCFFVESVPHYWLLLQCACVVHHGGSGTTHATLSSGIPSVITPVFLDQFRWARNAQSLGVGIGFEDSLPKIKPAVERLVAAIGEAESCAATAAALGKRLRMEDGARQAAAILDDFFWSEVATSQFKDAWVECQRLSADAKASLDMFSDGRDDPEMLEDSLTAADPDLFEIEDLEEDWYSSMVCPLHVDKAPLVVYAGWQFTGRENDFIDLRSLSSVGDLGGAFTIAFTAQWDRLHDYSRIVDFATTSARDNIIVANKEKSNTLTFRIWRGKSPVSLSASGAIVPGEFHRYMCRATANGVMTIHRDGVLLAEKTDGHCPQKVRREHLYVARSHWSTNGMFAGRVADLMVWNEAVDWANTRLPPLLRRQARIRERATEAATRRGPRKP